MNRDKRIANALLFTYGIFSLLVLCMPLSVPVLSIKACISYLINPVPYYGTRAVDRVTGMPEAVARLISADVENMKLRHELQRVPLLETELESVKKENDRLRLQMGLKPEKTRVLRWARVVERDPQNWYRYLVVEAGKGEGLEVNAPVLGALNGRIGAVGRVIEVGQLTSKVLLLADETSALASYFPAKQWEGLIEGQGGSMLRMNYLPPDAQVAIGDSVYTSPTGVTFPPDLLVGHVTRVFKPDPFLAFQAVEVSPSVPPDTLKEVLILLPLKFTEATKS
ncbi:MAG: rod shape-determining protein MreC [Elusimicrobia bacterium]|nr:rod shape-determining protein MreC [Elusimicrobiota bacterium]